jgi:hypothetical protein
MNGLRAPLQIWLNDGFNPAKHAAVALFFRTNGCTRYSSIRDYRMNGRANGRVVHGL